MRRSDDPRSDGPEDFSRIQLLFERALEWPAAERAQRLAIEVDDPSLRAEVLALVAAHEDEGALDRVTAALAHADEPTDPTGHGAPPGRIGPYRIAEEIGSGGMSRVYRAFHSDRPDGTPVALKVLRPEADTERVRRRFSAERQILAGLHHPRIAHLLDDGLTADGAPYLVTALIEGHAIDRYCDVTDAEPAGCMRLIEEACTAVAFAHERGIVHRDLKPSNIRVSSDGVVYLLDFGIAKVLDDQLFPGLGNPTTTGVHIMTLSYASPEQLLGEAITPASDVYQLALVLVRLVAGRLPPLHARLQAAPTAALDAHIDRSEGADRGRLSALRHVLSRALAPRVADRIATATELAQEIASARTA